MNGDVHKAAAARLAGEEPHRPTVPLQAPSRDRADEQALADSEQTLSEDDQTLADVDQTSADEDQTSADADQIAADRDQVASDRDLAAGGDPSVHDASRDARLSTTRQRASSADAREQTADARLDVAEQRDVIAGLRDRVAIARDHAAAARDRAMAEFDLTDEQAAGPRALTGTEVLLRAADQRRRAAGYRAKAAEHRVLAAEDRRLAARDREQAAHERVAALADREALARELAASAIDSLTGARTRAAGLADLENELDRCRRTSRVLVVAYLDVIGLKALNDTQGHAGGDELLRQAVAVVKAHLRSYDLVIRLGGDEFLCVMSNMTEAEARARFSQVAARLAGLSAPGAIRTGFAELGSGETAAEVIARADIELLNGRRT